MTEYLRLEHGVFSRCKYAAVQLYAGHVVKKEGMNLNV